MRKGFIFDTGKCVKCNACIAACRLYNNWDFQPRTVYTHNEKLIPGIPIINISLACNHCEHPACMDGCPSGAFFRDAASGAVLIDAERCLGCRYCQWNCPFDAPKFDEKKRMIAKCNLCHDSFYRGDAPSCSTACPTGALSYGELKGSNEISWFPSGMLKPAISFNGNLSTEALKVSPASLFSQDEGFLQKEFTRPEWSLVLFSFIAMFSVATQAASFVKGIFPGNIFFLQVILAAIVSLFHLGKPLKAFRSLKNVRHSPLSREILFFLLFAIFSLAATVMQMAEFAVAALVSGLILLILIDSVYARPDRKVLLHSGQTFLGGLLLISYFTDNILPFTFIVLLKTILTTRQLIKPGFGSFLPAVRFFKAAILLVALAGLISGYAKQEFSVSFIVISAEFIDRILYYLDFEPENIKRNISNNVKALYHEKKRG